MGKNLLVGVGSKARKVKALYVGVGGKARKVKKVYVGVGGKARLVYTSYVKCTDLSFTVKYEDYVNSVGITGAKNHYAIVTATTVPANATANTITVNSYGSWRPAIIDSRSSSGNSFTFKFHIKAGVSNSLMTVAIVRHGDGVTYYVNADFSTDTINRVVIDKTLRKQ